MRLWQALLLLALVCYPSPVWAELVLHVGWDGTDYDVASEMIDGGELPNLARLDVEKLEIVGSTQTKPSWITQLTGQPWTVTGVITNREWVPVRNPDWILPVQAYKAGLRGAMVTGKCPGHLCIWGEMFGIPMPLSGLDSTKLAYVYQSKAASMSTITSRCYTAALAVRQGYVFCHYQWPDVLGHATYGGSPEYRLALMNLDVELGKLMSALPEARVLLTSDHGFELPWRVTSDPVITSLTTDRNARPFGRTHIRAPLAIVASTEPIASGTERDIWKTVMAMLGLPVPAGRLEGKSLLLREATK